MADRSINKVILIGNLGQNAERNTSETLPDWDREDQHVSRIYGDEWFDSNRSLVLAVPSVVTRARSFNLLINQEHNEFHKLKPTKPQPVEWDQRLFLRKQTP